MIYLFLMVSACLLVWTFAAFAAGRSTGFVAGVKFERLDASRRERSRA